MDQLATYIVNPYANATPVVEQIKCKLRNQGIECTETFDRNVKTATLIWLEKVPVEVILQQLQALIARDYKVIITNVKNNLSDTVKWLLIQHGANDIVDWTEQDSLTKFMFARIKRWTVIEELLQSKTAKNKIIGDCCVWKRFLRKVIEVAYFTNNNVLLMGESGTGKELTAELIHSFDQRTDKSELILLDCTTIAPELSGSEFYGHEKGAFTNAFYTREGAFALADNGSLFLDELGELPRSMQAGLLRVIQEKTYKRVGSNTWRKTNFRLVCATNKNLLNEVSKGSFRKDLYYRIASAVFTLPALNERRDDIPELVRHFLREELKTIVAPEIDTTVMHYLVNRNYQGNIRELKQLIARMAIRYTGGDFITMGDLPEDELPEMDKLNEVWKDQSQNLQQSIRLAIASGKDLSRIKNDVASMAMEIAVEDCGGNLKLAARKLNVEVRTLQYIRQRNNGTV